MASAKLPGIGHLQAEDVDKSTGQLTLGKHNPKKLPVLIMIYSSWCGHCKKAAPAFKSVFDSHKQSKLFMCAICTDDKDDGCQELMKYFPDVMKNHGIPFRGVPTYVLVKNGKWSEVNARTVDDLNRLIREL